MRPPLAVVVGFLTATPLALAQEPSVFIDFTGANLSSGVPGASYGGAAPLVGEWNEVDGSSQSGSLPFEDLPLVNRFGEAILITLTIDATAGNIFGFGDDEPNTLGDDAALMDDCVYFTSPATFTFNNVPAGSYSVITYAMAPDVMNFATPPSTSIEVIGSPTGAQLAAGNFQGGFELGANFIVHAVVVDNTGTLVVRTRPVNISDAINGIQVIPHLATPLSPSTFCAANPNSTGTPGAISALGSTTAAFNSLTLVATDLPPGQFGIFVVSDAAGSTVTLGEGLLCLSGDIGRYQAPGQIFQVNPVGSASLLIDLAMVPRPSSFAATTVGDTWFFQAWHRDFDIGGSNTSNFTSGIELSFN